MCFDNSDNSPKVFICVDRKARKDHKCYECRQPIKAGEIYEYSHGIWDDGPADFKVCLRCVTLRNKIIEHERAEGCRIDEQAPPFGEVVSAAREMGLVVGEGGER